MIMRVIIKTKSLLIAAENNDMKTKYAKANIVYTQQNSKCRFCGDKDETIDEISQWRKL